jgi:predicted CoA-binding protein
MPSVAIIGASIKPDRYSHQAVVRYLERGYTVWPVHPSGHAVAGLTCYRSLADLPGTPDIISLYVNAAAGLGMLEAIDAADPQVLWLNPGADSDALQQAAEERGLKVVRACNLVALSYGDPLEVLDTMNHKRPHKG